MQNAFIESFNSKLRDECLNEYVFSNLGEARAIIEAWRHDYNHLRPHSSLGYLAPEEFAASNQGSSASARTAWPAQMLAGAVQGAPRTNRRPEIFDELPTRDDISGDASATSARRSGKTPAGSARTG